MSSQLCPQVRPHTPKRLLTPSCSFHHHCPIQAPPSPTGPLPQPPIWPSRLFSGPSLHRIQKNGLINKSLSCFKALRVKSKIYNKLYTHCPVWSLLLFPVPLRSHHSPLDSALQCTRLPIPHLCSPGYGPLPSLLLYNCSFLHFSSLFLPTITHTHIHTPFLQG